MGSHRGSLSTVITSKPCNAYTLLTDCVPENKSSNLGLVSGMGGGCTTNESKISGVIPAFLIQKSVLEKISGLFKLGALPEIYVQGQGGSSVNGSGIGTWHAHVLSEVGSAISTGVDDEVVGGVVTLLLAVFLEGRGVVEVEA